MGIFGCIAMRFQLSATQDAWHLLVVESCWFHCEATDRGIIFWWLSLHRRFETVYPGRFVRALVPACGYRYSGRHDKLMVLPMRVLRSCLLDRYPSDDNPLLSVGASIATRHRSCVPAFPVPTCLI
jgi:hypothetical protein